MATWFDSPSWETDIGTGDFVQRANFASRDCCRSQGLGDLLVDVRFDGPLLYGSPNDFVGQTGGDGRVWVHAADIFDRGGERNATG